MLGLVRILVQACIVHYKFHVQTTQERWGKIVSLIASTHSIYSHLLQKAVFLLDFVINPFYIILYIFFLYIYYIIND